ncbi:MAG: N-acetylmuramic acid 6-phosphate etherase [Christensenellales bacterium]|uniref:N-acetylmuramic acid 6-phosphate etherase n=1 Tax=Candidatus Avichristensenella intestinipullorum TaxID=2840693 RepID=A0A9D0YVV6_9FIRM|nr:N-acetylmuramic acid 6-phosphate etherase [Christensenellales bacterium]HIQ62341.1 N-acetylmuramic acid 6-phosphate etherase [Candidatus Avichristensenella intestinipullorum]
MDTYLAGLSTESVSEATRDIDLCTTGEMVALMNRQDAQVAQAVGAQSARIAQAIDLIYACLRRGGRLIYLGAGTSGRLGVLDASECPPTFGVEPEKVQGYIAGGDRALRQAVEGCEDDEAEGEALVDGLAVGPDDAVVGITASGSAPYVLAALRRARARGSVTIGLCTNAHSLLESLCDVTIAPEVGPEVISGSTRLKSGTAQKMVLNMLSTCTMVKLGKVYGNLMVDLRASNKKLIDRARRLVVYATGASDAEAAQALEAARGHAKLAILMITSGWDAARAERLLNRCEGRLRDAIRAAKEETHV